MPSRIMTKRDIAQVMLFDWYYNRLPGTMSDLDRFVTALSLTSDDRVGEIIELIPEEAIELLEKVKKKRESSILGLHYDDDYGIIDSDDGENGYVK